MLNLAVQTIPHSSQRYDTAGDWFSDSDGTTHIRVSACGNRRYEWLLALHELVECALCESGGVTADMVDVFDNAHTGDGEAGDNPASPYRDAHCFATAVERMLCAAMGVSWREYDDFVNQFS